MEAVFTCCDVFEYWLQNTVFQGCICYFNLKEVIKRMLFWPNKHEKIVISVRIDKDLVDRIDKVASETNLSRNEVICQSIEFALNNTDEEAEERAEKG